MKITYRLGLPLVATLLAVTAAACGDDSTDTATSETDSGGQQTEAAPEGGDASGADCAVDGGTVKIGYVGTLSGPASFLGQAPLEGVELAVDEHNASDAGYTFEVVTADDEIDPAAGVAAAQKLINQDKVDVLIGAAHSGVSQAIMGVAEQAEVPQISPLSALNGLTEPVNPHFFRYWNKDAVIADTLAQFAIEHFDKVGLLYETTAFGQGGKDALTAAFEDHGESLAAAEAFDLNAQDLTPQLSKLRNAGADAVIVQSQGPQAALTARNLDQLGYDATIIGHPGLAQRGFPDLAQGAAEGAIVIDGLDRDRPETQAFIDAYEAEHGEDPFSFYPATGYDIVHLIDEALRAADCDKDSIRDGLEQIEDFQGVVGGPDVEVSYGPEDHDGVGAGALIFKEIRDGELVLFEGTQG